MSKGKLASRFILSQYDYSTHRHAALDEYSSFAAAQNALWNIALYYIELKDGQQKLAEKPTKDPGYVFSKKEFKKLRNKLVAGHYLIKDPEDHFTRVSLWGKIPTTMTKHGGRTVVRLIWRRIFDLDVVELPSEVLKSLDESINAPNMEPLIPQDVLADRKNKAIAFGKTLDGLNCMALLRKAVDEGRSLSIHEIYRRCPADFGSDEEPYVDVPAPPVPAKRSYFARKFSQFKRKIGLKKSSVAPAEVAVDDCADQCADKCDDAADVTSASVDVNAGAVVDAASDAVSNAVADTAADASIAANSVLSKVEDVASAAVSTVSDVASTVVDDVKSVASTLDNIIADPPKVDVSVSVDASVSDQTPDASSSSYSNLSDPGIPAPLSPKQLSQQMEEIQRQLKLAKERQQSLR